MESKPNILDPDIFRKNPKNPLCSCSKCIHGIEPDFMRDKSTVFNIVGCNCGKPPPACHGCRSLNKKFLCRYCGQIGRIETIKKASKGILRPIRVFSNIQSSISKSSKYKKMGHDWRFFSRYFQLSETMTGFKRWLQTQKIRGVTRFESTELQTLQMLQMKQATFARMIVCKLDLDAKDRSEAFRESYLPIRHVYLWQKVVAKVIRRITAIFADLNSFSIEIK